MPLATPMVTCTMMGDSELGSTWPKMILRSLTPETRAASMYSSSRTGSTAARAVRANHGNVHQTHGQHQYEQALAEGGHDGDAQQHAGDTHEHLTHTEDDVFDHAAVIAGDQPQRGAQRAADGHGDDTDSQRVLGTVQNTGQHIAAILVGTQKMAVHAGLEEAVHNVLLDDVRFDNHR